MVTIRTLLLALCFLYVTDGICQTGRSVNDRLEELIQEKRFHELQNISAKALTTFRAQNQIDSIITYSWYAGMAAVNLEGLPAAERRLTSIIENDILKRNATGDQIAEAYLMAANLLGYEGSSKRAYSMLKKLSDNKAIKEKIKHLQFRIESNMGLFSMKLGQYAVSSIHYRRSLQLFPPEDVKSEEYFSALNSMGIALYQSAKLDSSIYYFNLANDFLNDLDDSPVNRLYRSGILDSNIGLVYSDKGETNKSNEYAERAIEKYRRFLMADTNFPQKKSAAINRLFCIDNLASTLLESGDYLKAKNLFSYALSEKQKLFGEIDPEVYASYINMSAVSLSREEVENTIRYAEKALLIIRKIGDTLTLYDAEGYSNLAQAWVKKGDMEKASFYFSKADEILAQIHGGEFSLDYLQFLNKYALFKARIHEGSKAEMLSGKSLVYALKTNPEYSLPVAMQILNAMEVYLRLKKYKTSLAHSQKAISIFNKLTANAETMEDSIGFESFKASAILGKSKSAYYLLGQKSEDNLLRILHELEEASAMYERRKLYYPAHENVSVTIESYKEINDFINFLSLQLYKITNDKSYLDAVIQKSESLVYTRLKRSLNNKTVDVYFRDVPSSIQKEEKEIKALLEDALKRNKPGIGSVDKYFEQSKRWDDFLSMLKKNYPAYYRARYGNSAKKDIAAYNRLVPEDCQIVRFYIINENIYAFILSQNDDHWIALPTKGLADILIELKSRATLEQTGFLTYKLYEQLWKPIEPFIHEKRITIIPDGILYNISFDMLTTKPVTNGRDLSAFSLLNKYAFSYQYSLDVLSQQKSGRKRYSGISAFAPTFSDAQKQDYISSLKTDTLQIDKSYLTLLPLPFSRDLADNLESTFGGTVFTGSAATVSNFKKNAGNHSIIYIGTHAEPNNQYPEYSRMFFAKDINTPTGDNSLYLYDIYNQNLNADLAVLTACETGQSNFFPGEGMISMAHAFHYAGSESVLTGLWKIDERASTLITEAFYKNLQKGMTKDVALQQAKLHYLKKAYGRMLMPQYWAGLVIMGDTKSIEFKNDPPPYYWLVPGVLLLSGGFLYLRKRRKHQRR